MAISAMLQYAVEHNASDLHLSAGLVPKVRIDGDLVDVEGAEAISDSQLHDLLTQILPKEEADQLDSKFEIDLSLSLENLARCRVNVFKQSHGLAAVFRIIPLEIKSLQELELPPILEDFCKFPNGIILVTGPTGSGKSTTLAAMLNYINETMLKHIVTMEDPIEFVYKSKKCLIQQREIHQNTASFQDALRAVLREDPDVILVGEMRDTETIRLALTAAETGHLVLATLHTSSAPKTINRVVDVFPGEERSLVRTMLSESLQAVVSQTLLKRKGGGRIAAQEIMVSNPAIRNLIREDKVAQMLSIMQTQQGVGMKTMEQSIRELQSKGLIESEVNSA